MFWGSGAPRKCGGPEVPPGILQAWTRLLLLLLWILVGNLHPCYLLLSSNPAHSVFLHRLCNYTICTLQSNFVALLSVTMSDLSRTRSDLTLTRSVPVLPYCKERACTVPDLPNGQYRLHALIMMLILLISMIMMMAMMTTPTCLYRCLWHYDDPQGTMMMLI